MPISSASNPPALPHGTCLIVRPQPRFLDYFFSLTHPWGREAVPEALTPHVSIILQYRFFSLKTQGFLYCPWLTS